LPVDGEHHGEQLAYDARRDRWLGEIGFRVLRFWVAEVDQNIESIIETITEALCWIPPQTPHLPPPASRGEDYCP